MNLIHEILLKIKRQVNENHKGRIAIYGGWIFLPDGYEYQINPIIRKGIPEVRTIART